jgi:CubicO group peptidase (beta-lactamase class C family)
VSGRTLTDVLEHHSFAHHVPGAGVGLVVDGEVYTAYSGLADRAAGTPVTPATRFGIGSLTKSMVASALAMLAADRRLAFDDPVAIHVPELRSCAWAQASSLRDLLANRSPIPLTSALEFGFEEHKDEDDQALTRLVSAVSAGVPSGGHWSYSNMGWCVLGRVIETVTGDVWDEAMPRLLAPVGLSETIWTTSGSANRAVGYDSSPDGPVPLEPLLCRAYSPAGATIASTLPDMLRYAAWHLAEPVLAVLREVHAEVSIRGWLDAWGLGWGKFDWGGEAVWGWDGVVHGQRSVLRLLPNRATAAVVLTNGSAGRALARGVLMDGGPDWFGLAVPPLPQNSAPAPPERLSLYRGAYGWPDRRVDVQATDRSMTVTEEGVTRQALPLGSGIFLIDPGNPDTPTITFADFDRNGRPGVLYDMVWGLPRLPEH